MAPLLSVIIPLFNGEEYVDNIYNAFSAQGSTDFELICVDDGSTDNTYQKLLDLQKNHPELNMVVKHQDNCGVSAARNVGLRIATGKYISFFDCDDYISKNYFDVLKNNLDKDFDIFVFQSQRVKFEDIAETTSKDVVETTNLKLLSRFANKPTQFGVYNMFVSREFYDANKFLFREGIPYYEDYEFLYRVFAKANKILLTEQQLYYYILRDVSAMQKFTKARLTSIKVIEELRSFIENQVPEFLLEFDLLSTSRLYWSIMWQACLAFDYKDAKEFYTKYDIENKVNVLKNNLSLKISLSTRIMMISFRLYYMMVSCAGGKKSNIKKITLADFENT